MNGEIYLIRTAAEKIVPALCLKQEKVFIVLLKSEVQAKKRKLTPFFKTT